MEDLQQLGRGEARLRAERVSCFVLSDRRLCLVCGGIPVSVPHPGFVSSSKSTRIMASKLVSRGKKVLQRARTNSHPVEGETGHCWQFVFSLTSETPSLIIVIFFGAFQILRLSMHEKLFANKIITVSLSCVVLHPWSSCYLSFCHQTANCRATEH